MCAADCNAARRNDADLLAGFESTTLPFAEWTHEAHLRVAYLHLLQMAPAAALATMRRRIQAYNKAHDVPTTPTRGYHETITAAWIRVLAARLAEIGPADDSLAFFRRNAEFLEKGYLLRFYSTERLMSLDARAKFVEPDLEVLPASRSAR